MVLNVRGEDVGSVESDCYVNKRDWSKGQVFREPSFGNALAIDVSILKRLVSTGVVWLRFLVVNFPDEAPFWVRVKVSTFLIKSKEIHFYKHGRQRYLELDQWIREKGSLFEFEKV